VARRHFEDEVLQDGGVKHGCVCARLVLISSSRSLEGWERTKTSDEETGVDTFDWREVDTPLAEEGVDDIIEDRNHDYDADGVQVPRITKVSIFLTIPGIWGVLDQIVRCTIKFHGSRNSAEISINLGVALKE
jgi:hypothetical protein